MDIPEYDNKIAILEAERQELFVKKAPIDKRLGETYNELQSLYNARDTLELAKSDKKLDINLILTANHTSTVKFQEADRQIRELGLTRHGYWAAINQCAISIMLTQENLNKTFSSVMLLLPHIKPFPENNGLLTAKKVFHIFEHTLSQHGTYNFAIAGDKCEVIRSCY